VIQSTIHSMLVRHNRLSRASCLLLVFYCLAVTVEDLMHDSSVIELLWTSCGDPELVEAIKEEDVAMKVRTWIGELLSRSLLLGNAAGIHLHGACVNVSMQLSLAFAF